MKQMIRKTYLSIFTSILVLIVSITTTYAWAGILSYSSTEQFTINLEKIEHSDYSLMISLDGIHFSEGISMVQLRRTILSNMDVDCSNLSDTVVNDVFSKLVMNPVSMQQNGNEIGPFVCLEDITGVSKFNYASVVNESEKAKKSYFNFDLYLSFDYTGSKELVSEEVINDSQSVMLSNISNLLVGPTKGIQLSKPYQFQDYFNQEEIKVTKVDITSAARVALTKYEVVERGHPESVSTVSDLILYQGGTATPTYEDGVYSFGGIMDKNNNLAFTEYNNINSKKIDSAILDEFYQNRCNESGLENAIALDDLEDGHWIIQKEDGLCAQTMMKINVKMWIEGFDGDCFNVIGRSPITLNLIFSTTKKTDEE